MAALFSKTDLARYHELESQIKKLTTEYEKMKAEFKEKLPLGGPWIVDDLEVSVTTRKAPVDKDKAASKYPADEFAHLYVEVIDNDKLKENLSPKQIDEVRGPEQKIVSVKAAKKVNTDEV